MQRRVARAARRRGARARIDARRAAEALAPRAPCSSGCSQKRHDLRRGGAAPRGQPRQPRPARARRRRALRPRRPQRRAGDRRRPRRAPRSRRMTQTKRAAQAQAAVARARRARASARCRSCARAGVDTATRATGSPASAPSRSTSAAVERDPLAHFAVVRASAGASCCRRRRPPPTRSARRSTRDSAETFLLHGVTGSGKTEVYLHALDRCVAPGRRAIVLVPEIALTPQTVRRFRERFERVAVLHSGLTRRRAVRPVARHRAGPLRRRHRRRARRSSRRSRTSGSSSSTKSTSGRTSSTTRSRATTRATSRSSWRGCTGAAVVLGSATPDVASYELARERRRTRCSTLPERIRPVAGRTARAGPRPRLRCRRSTSSTCARSCKPGNRSMFSRELQRRDRAALAADEQVILFLNRRGLAGHVQCRDCGFVPECSSLRRRADLPQQYDRLVCHQCNRQLARCPRPASSAAARASACSASASRRSRRRRRARSRTRACCAGTATSRAAATRTSRSSRSSWRTRPTSSSARRCWRRGSTCRPSRSSAS